jgi:hypothetical protein
LHSRVLKLGGGDHRKFDRVGYMIGLVAGYVTCLVETFSLTRPSSSGMERTDAGLGVRSRSKEVRYRFGHV